MREENGPKDALAVWWLDVLRRIGKIYSVNLATLLSTPEGRLRPTLTVYTARKVLAAEAARRLGEEGAMHWLLAVTNMQRKTISRLLEARRDPGVVYMVERLRELA